MRTLLALVVVVGCSGTAGVRDHSEAIVVATHCRDHACPATPAARSLGDGCYAVDDLLYQCSNDELPHGEASCFEVRWHAGAWAYHRTDSRGREISTERCRERWRADREAHRPPPTCSPARLEVAIGSAAAGSPSDLPLPAALVIEVSRSGRSRLTYEVEACATDGGVVPGEATRATGFPELDRVLRGKVAELALPPGQCARVALVASRFECEPEKSDL